MQQQETRKTMGPPSAALALAGKLIKHVKQHPILYDPNDVDYRNNEKKDEIWDTIAEDLKENVMDVKKRWRNLRDTYVKLLKLVKGSEKDPVVEAEAVHKYKRWVWTREMEFFRSHLTYGNQMTVDFNTLSKIPISRQRKPRSDTIKRSTDIKREHSLSPSSTPTKKVKTKKGLRSEKTVKIEKVPQLVRETSIIEPARLKEKLDISNGLKKLTSIELDATDRLFLAHAQNIKQFTARRQALTKLKIAEVIMEQEILHQEDVELASISATTAKLMPKNHSQHDDSPQPFESVCGYDSDDENIDQRRTQTDADPMDSD